MRYMFQNFFNLQKSTAPGDTWSVCVRTQIYFVLGKRAFERSIYPHKLRVFLQQLSWWGVVGHTGSPLAATSDICVLVWLSYSWCLVCVDDRQVRRPQRSTSWRRISWLTWKKACFRKSSSLTTFRGWWGSCVMPTLRFVGRCFTACPSRLVWTSRVQWFLSSVCPSVCMMRSLLTEEKTVNSEKSKVQKTAAKTVIVLCIFEVGGKCGKAQAFSLLGIALSDCWDYLWKLTSSPLKFDIRSP